MADLDTRIMDFAPSTDLYAKSNIKFKGKLQHFNLTLQDWYPLSLATIHVTIKDINNNILGEVIGITSDSILDLGQFTTTHFFIPDYYANNDIIVEAKFLGGTTPGGDLLKPTEYSTIYHVLGICDNVSSRTGECNTELYNVEEFPTVPVLAFLAGTVVIGLYIKRRYR